MAQPGALANLDHERCLERIASGVMCKQIAAEYGVTPRAIRYQLEKHPDYKNAIAEQAHAFVEDAIDEVRNIAADALLIARARVRVDTAFKYAAAHNPAYAAKQQITQVSLTVVASDALSVDAGSLLSQVRGMTIEHDASHNTHALPNKQADDA